MNMASLKPMLTPKLLAALILLLAGTGLMFVGMPKSQAKIERMKPTFDKTLKNRSRHIDPAELLDLMYNNQLHLFMIDVRNEADYNLFHLRDAIHRPLSGLNPECCRKLKVEGIKVVMSNDERAAEQAYKYLTANGVLNVYILAGGINLWLDIYSEGKPGPAHEAIDGHGNDRLRQHFKSALGHLHPASLPDRDKVPRREFPTKVKVSGPKRMPGGGCG